MVGIVNRILSVLSATACCIVIVLYCRNPDFLRYQRPLLFIMCSILIASIGMMFGATRSGSAACYFQGISSLFGYLSALFWSAYISFRVWCAVTRKVDISTVESISVHLFCWGWPLILVLLPLTTETYSNFDDVDAAWCFIGNDRKSQWISIFWGLMAFISIWIGIAISILFLVFTDMEIRKLSSSVNVKNSVWKFARYPIVSVIAWLPATILNAIDTAVFFDSGASAQIDMAAFADFANAAVIFQGVAILYIFLVDNWSTVFNNWLIERTESTPARPSDGCIDDWVVNPALVRESIEISGVTTPI